MKTKILSLFLAVVMLFSVLSVGATAESLTEVPEGYVGVYTKDDLFAVRENPSGKYILMNDIIFDDADYVNGGDFYNSGKGWEPIGTSATPFKGTFDGNGYEIVNLQINNPEGDYQGLFGYTSSATIKGVNLNDAYIMGGDYTGGVVGYDMSYTTLSDCCCDGYIFGNSYVGGIIGYKSYGAKDNVVGHITNCINFAQIFGANSVGGISGLTHSFAGRGYQNVTVYYPVYIQRCINSGDIVCSGTDAGGIVGDTNYTENNPYYNYAAICIQNCYNVGNVSSKNYAGGILGFDARKNITEYSYSTGNVTAETNNYGGCFGNEPYQATFCYYLEDAVSDPDCLAGTPKSPDQLKKQGTFEQWDFDTVWTMEGREDFPYPELRDVPLVFPDDSKTEISGTVTVKGEAKVGSTLTAEITGVSPEGATFEYEWKADGKIVGTEATYTVTQDDVGKNITLTVKGCGDFKGDFSSSAIIGECVHSVAEYTDNNDATCYKNETKSGVCEKCNATVTEEIEDSKFPHTFINYIYDNNATCTADGTKTAKCENCNATDTITAEKTMLEHNFSDSWTIDKDATCTEEGIKSHHCKDCTATKDETVLNKLAHIYVADVTEATCYDDGKIVYTCSCGDTYSKNLYATGHVDSDNDNICDECEEIINNDCDCICHSSSGFLSFIWKVLSFLNRLFGTNAICGCGIAHW